MSPNPPGLSPLSPLTRAHSRFPVRLLVRMTRAERAIIGKRACALNRSLSRYLVGLANEEATFVMQRETARTRLLVTLFGNAVQKVRELPTLEGTLEEPLREALGEVLNVLEALALEMGREAR